MSEQESRLERWYLVSELVELTGVKKSMINAAIRSGRLKAVTPNGGTRWRMISESEWNRFMTESEER